MKDVEIEFDFITGKNDVVSSLNAIKSSAIGAVGAVAAVAFGIKKFADAAIESEESVSRLNVALKQTGIYSESTTKDLQSLATQIQKTTVYTDDQAMALQSTLQNLGQFTKDGLIQATKASIELASAMKIDLNTAATLVGKAASGNIQAFQRMGIEIKKGKTDAETFANTLQALARFEGASSEEAKTLGGSIKSLSNSFGELIETASKGASVFLSIKEASNAVKNSVDKVNENLSDSLFKGISSSAFELLAVLPTKLGSAIGESIRSAIGLSVKDSMSSAQRIIDSEKNISKQSPGVQSLFSTDVNNLAPKSQVSLIGDIAKVSMESQKLLLDTQARQDEIIAKNKKERDEARKSFLELVKQIENAGKTQDQIASDEATKRLSEVDSLYAKKYISEKEYADARLKIEQDYSDKVSKLDEQSRKESLEKFSQELKEKERLRKESEERIANIANKSLGAVTNILQGKEGARSLISSGAGAIAESFAPGTGQAAGALVSQLSQGPEATRAMVKEFAAAVPDLIQSIVESIPVLIEELANQFPVVIERMVEKFSDPKFLEGITKAFIKAGVAMATAQVKAFIAQIPKFFQDFGKSIVSAIVDGIKQAISAITGAAGDFVQSIPVVGGVLGGVADFLGFARGGQVMSVPNGFPNDTFPASLTSGELVVDRSTVERLNDFMDGNSQQSAGLSESLLARILDKLSEPMNVSTTASLNGKALADIILQLNRNNARLTV